MLCTSRSSLYCNIPSDLCTLCVWRLLLLYCFIFILVLLLCCVSRSSLYCNIPSDLCTLCFSCYYFYIVLSLYLYCCYALYTDHHFTVIFIQICLLCVCLVNTSKLFYLYTNNVEVITRQTQTTQVWTYITVNRWSGYTTLYCCYAVYSDHHFTVIYLQTCVVCVFLVITSTLFYLYTCTVVMLCIHIITLL